ncbi:MAG: hypothetical protein QOI54_179 [Actinomycetota bacterium]|jgi:hypothetical protein|nr:hypothetical protein [Actinomycetota bacterium]
MSTPPVSPAVHLPLGDVVRWQLLLTDRSRPRPSEVSWVGPELGLGLRSRVPPDAPLAEARRRRQALTTTASGAIG